MNKWFEAEMEKLREELHSQQTDAVKIAFFSFILRINCLISVCLVISRTECRVP